MAFVKLNGIVIHYLDEGPREAKTIVFSNSLGTDFRIWNDLVKTLKSEFRIIRYDNRGHGLSSCPLSPYKIDDHINDLSELIDFLEISELSMVGLSVGGLITQGLINTRPDIVQSAVLCDTAHKILNRETWNSRIAAVKESGLEILVDSTMERWFSKKFKYDNPTEVEGARNMFLCTPQEGYLGTCAAIRDADFTTAAKKIKIPILCVVGDEDGSTPVDVVRETSEIIPGARLAIINGAGHIPCLEKPNELAILIKQFLND
ncbi:MAG: 3-oxoadipate enol-lactonase [Alphaproteobacteria bacterium]|nr:3-oxoadipate enol-lactonase [Alphaproteobacteria bacterium]|tara:strand:- start:4234 stop:5016 length:783 start_codon:yes stop_codon:yes gene_type:complete